MKNISILFLFLFFSFSFSQTYQFDFLTKYSVSNNKNKFTSDFVSYNNSDDFSYYLRLNRNEEGHTAVLYDDQREIAHHFSVIESVVNGEMQFQFLYINSSKLKSTNYLKNYRYEFSELNESNPKKVVLKIYKFKKAKKPISEKEFTLEKANKNLIPLYRSEWLHQYSNYENVNKIGNYIVSKAVENYKIGICESNLKEYKNVDLKIIVPEKFKL